MDNLARLPKGLWYEEPKRRFRVRRYHNKVVYGPKYFRTLGAAMAALEALAEEIAQIPKNQRPPRQKNNRSEH
jgi:hypothetical protein